VFLYMAPEKQNPAAGRDARLRGSAILCGGPLRGSCRAV
jgi:hypothetical protein